ncbi:DUF3034 family protein [Solimicrobium silvestre]|uniref:DUF3034 family protein n=1 Tax=Solimicrobium silvestre TaxID=2099400 RepID=A0A2S9GSP0_9BURK|nr:DUF3034 family protein [Solimicrobium silvestre]PRC90742.1 hypothetical protein S2091_4568 [Solimicrobium silvestre]
MKLNHFNSLTLMAAMIGLTLNSSGAFADDTNKPAYIPDMGKLLATGGISTVEGAAGGGITPWALIGGYGTRDSYGANAHYTYLGTQDFALDTFGATVGIMDRIELSVARQNFKSNNGPLNGLNIQQDIFGVKVKIAGDAVYDQDSCMPQIAVGAEYKKNNGLTGIMNAPVTALGAQKTSGTDYYVSATKLFLDQSILADVTIRATEANQMGLLGFGGDLNDSYKAEFEGSLGYLFTKNWVAGVEYREKPHNLKADNEAAYYDAFVAWFPTKTVSFTLAYANLGSIVAPVTMNNQSQKGLYLSLQAGF